MSAKTTQSLVTGAVLPFQLKCRLGHPENYLFSLSKKTYFLDQITPKNISFDFANRSTAQVALYYTISIGHWAQAALVFYFYAVCFTYGFGALGVAMNTVHEKDSQLDLLEERRRDLLVQCYLCWDDRFGPVAERNSVKDVAFQLRDVRSVLLYSNVDNTFENL